MKNLIFILIILLVANAAFASTQEAAASNFLTECDITFWQTLPFAALWGYFLDSQLSAGAALHWEIVVPVAIAISAGNAYFHARKVVK